MILAAGFGKRLRPFTLTTPKPLLPVGSETLIERHLYRLAASGITEVVINVAHLGHMIEKRIQDGSRYGLQVQYSREPEHSPLETGGAVKEILPWFGDEAFLLVAADIWTDFHFKDLLAQSKRLADEDIDALLTVVSPPNWSGRHDFYWKPDTHQIAHNLLGDAWQPVGFSGFGILHPRMWKDAHKTCFPLSDVLWSKILVGRVKGMYFSGPWFNVGCQARLGELQMHLSESSPANV